MFETTGPHYCPNCEPILNKKDRRVDEPLKLVVKNYSGCAVDIAVCPRCNHRFQISYKVDKVLDVEEEFRKIERSYEEQYANIRDKKKKK
jgi:uncharacterized Zn finger protein (UPF0148 family)